jgi:hypothetical protein
VRQRAQEQCVQFRQRDVQRDLGGGAVAAECHARGLDARGRHEGLDAQLDGLAVPFDARGPSGPPRHTVPLAPQPVGVGGRCDVTLGTHAKGDRAPAEK